MLQNLKQLCDIPGVSGRENKVRDFIISKIEGQCEYKTDNLGNLICYKKGTKGSRSQTLMVSAHMDEVGLIVTAITDEGYLRFSPVGGIDTRVLAGQAVIINDIPGVIGAKAVHMLDASEKDTALKSENLMIDIGADSKEQALRYVNPGDTASFAPNYSEFGKGCVRSKALDDRFGCAVMIDMILNEVDYDTYFVFTVQEEVGTRGAAAAAFSVKPDISLVIETTTACDIAGVELAKQICAVGGGPVISFMDKSNMYDMELYRQVNNLAVQNNIPAQTKSMIAGGNDSGAIAVSRSGVRTIAISLPCRYLHTPSCMASVSDMEHTARLAKLFVNM